MVNSVVYLVVGIKAVVVVVAAESVDVTHEWRAVVYIPPVDVDIGSRDQLAGDSVVCFVKLKQREVDQRDTSWTRSVYVPASPNERVKHDPEYLFRTEA
jgi:hypothetical protein